MKKHLSVHTIFSAIYAVLALLTVIPNDGASKACRLGYEALCSFAPYSTLILMALAGLHIYLRRRAASLKAK